MLVSDIINMIKDSLTDDNIYRTDAFLLARLNEGYKLTAALGLFDERRSSVDIDGTRNLFAVPKSGNAVCIAPLYIADTNTGERVNPCRLDQFEYYSTQWEGIVAGDVSGHYTLLSPYNYTHAAIVVCPITETGKAQYTIMAAFEPVTLTTTDSPRLADAFVMVLVHYTRFAAFVSEPGRADDVTASYKAYITELEKLVTSLKSRFPSGRDFEPHPPEFVYDNITEQQRKVAAPKEEQRES